MNQISPSRIAWTLLLWTTILVAAGTPGGGLHAQTWSGANGNGLWSTPGNWSGGVPANNANLVTFSNASSPGGAVNVDLAAPFQFGLNSGSVFTVDSRLNNQGYSFSGQRFIFDNESSLRVNGAGNVFNNDWQVDASNIGNTRLEIFGDQPAQFTFGGNLTTTTTNSTNGAVLFRQQSRINGTVNVGVQLNFQANTEINGSVRGGGSGGGFPGGTFFGSTGAVNVSGSGSVLGLSRFFDTTFQSSLANPLVIDGTSTMFNSVVAGGLAVGANGMIEVGVAGPGGGSTLTVNQGASIRGLTSGFSIIINANSTLRNGGSIDATGSPANGTISLGTNSVLTGLNANYGVINARVTSIGSINNNVFNGQVTWSGGIIGAGIYNADARGANGLIGAASGLAEVVVNQSMQIESGTGLTNNVRFSGNGVIGATGANSVLSIGSNTVISSSVNMQAVNGALIRQIGNLGSAGTTLCNNLVLSNGRLDGVATEYVVHGNMTVLGDTPGFFTTNIVNQTLRVNGALVVQDRALLGVAQGRTITALGGLQVSEQGILGGSGTVVGDLQVLGEISPGNSAGILDVDGTVDLGSTSNVCIEIGGTVAGTQYDRLRGQGSSQLALDGLLSIDLIDGFQPGAGDSFLIVENMALTGRFSNAPGSYISFAEGQFRIEYGSNFVRLFEYAPIPEPGSALVWFAFLLGGLRGRWGRLQGLPQTTAAA